MSKKHFCFLMGFLFILQLWVLFYICNTTLSSDADIIRSYVVNGGYDRNFLYRNFIVQIYRLFWNLTGRQEYWRTMCLLNIIFADIAIIFAYVTAKRLFGNRIANISFVFMVFLIGLNEATITCPYTDVTLMAFVSVALYLMMQIYYSKSRRMGLVVLLAATFAFGFLVKPHMAALIAAAAMVFVVRKISKRGLILVITGLFIFCGIVGVYNGAMRLCVKELEHPPHWLYMYAQSLEYDLDLDLHLGIYDYGNNNTTIEEKQQFLNNYIRERMRELGPVGYIKLLFNKTFLLLGDGIKSQTCNRRGIEYQSNFFSRIYYESVVGNVLRYVLWVTLMFGVVLNLFDKKRSPFHSLVKLFPLVIFTLLLFTETSSRYLIGFLPLLCIGSVLGYAHCLTRLKKCDTINHG